MIGGLEEQLLMKLASWKGNVAAFLQEVVVQELKLFDDLVLALQPVYLAVEPVILIGGVVVLMLVERLPLAERAGPFQA